MLITTFGPPAAFTRWSNFLLRIFTDVTHWQVSYFAVPNGAELREVWATHHGLMSARHCG
jgi:hypothetical protein